MEALQLNSQPSHEALRWLQMAHDLKSPLTVLRLMTGRMSGANHEERELIEDAIHRVLEIVAEVLEPQVRESSVWEPDLLRTLIRQKEIEFPNIRFCLDIAVREPAQSRLPALVLNRILSNLLNNACEANGGQGEIRIRVGTAPAGYQIEIEDEGPGIPADIREVLGTLGISGKADGKLRRGIGLFSALQALRRFEGSLAIDDQMADKGTVVRLNV